MDTSHKLSLSGLLIGLFLGLAVNNAYAANLSIADSPVFLSNSAKPNILIMLDNSGSMKRRMYTSNFDSSTEYSGLFDNTKTYKYNTTVPVNGAAYNVAVDTSKTGAFYDTTCTPGQAGCWDGNFLNWLTSRRIDTSRDALVGGKLESRTPFTYGTFNSVAYTYKIIANNERSDSGSNANTIINDEFEDDYSASASFSPIPDDNEPTVISPANDGNTQTSYDPYAKLTFKDGNNDSGNTVTRNLAVIVTEKPTGLIQDVEDQVRLGVSFYRYSGSASDIYNGNQIDGGTMRFNIPNNPFVSQPPDYRSLEGYIGSDIDDIVDAIEHYPLVWGTTPLAENLLEVIRYFQQATPEYNGVSGVDDGFVVGKGTTRDPYLVPGKGKLSCTKSSVLVVTDGEPFRDVNVSNTFRTYDGDSNDGTPGPSGRSDYLDDVARWAHCSSSTGTCDANTGTGLRDLRTDLELTGDQYLNIHTVAFANGIIPQILQDTANNGGGSYSAAADGATLKAALTKAIKTTLSTNTSASAVTTNSSRLNANSQVFQATFIPNGWVGDLIAYNIDSSGNVNSTAAWTASNNIPAYSTRKVFTYNTTGTEFEWGKLSQAQKDSIDLVAAVGQSKLDYILGDTQNEERNTGTYSYRDRVNDSGNSHILGDIINSSPWFAGNVDFGYVTLPEGNSSATNPYQTFLSNNDSSNRKEALYVGANDGMLHAIDASDGTELFAYIPSFIIPKLTNLTNTSYTHEYFVDGPVKVGDVSFTNDTWHTVLVATTGAGARGLFALDVTTPGSFAKSDVLWEITNNTAGYSDLGYTMTEPSIVRMANGKWAAIVASGYNSTDDSAVIYIIDIEDGSLIKKFDTGTGTSKTPSTPNGMSTPIAVDINGDQIVDSIYAGDLRGNMWKIDVDSSDKGNWKFAFQDSSNSPAPLFKAVDYLGAAQPITAKPLVGPHPLGGFMIYFGTGKYFENSDNTVVASTQRQTFYATRDGFNTTAATSATSITGSAAINSRTNDLTQQSIISQFNFTTLGSTNINNDLRYVSNYTVNYSSKKGWFIDLIDPAKASPNTVDSDGERVVSAPLIRGNRIVFVTLEPEIDPCGFGGSSWFMELDTINGATLAKQPFDLNDDGVVNAEDLAYLIDTNTDGNIDINDDGKNTSGRRLSGISGTPTVVDDGNKEHKLFGTSQGTVKKVTETKDVKAGRQSWRQLK